MKRPRVNPLGLLWQQMRSFSLLFTFVFCFTINLCLKAQNTQQIQVLDIENQEPIAMAHLIFISPQDSVFAITGDDGIAQIKIQKPGLLHISHIAHQSATQNLSPKSSIHTVNLTPRHKELNEVVVTGQSNPIPANQAVKKIKVINRQRIDQQAAVNLKDLLSNDLNFRLQEDAVLGSQMSMQGLDGQKIKILIDGVPVIGRLDGNIDLSQINLNNIERVEIAEGPMSVEYGTDAVAGTINLITKKNYSKNFEGKLNTYYESVGRYNIDGGLNIPIGKASATLNLGRNFFDGYNENEDQRSSSWNPKEQYFLSAGIQRRFKSLLIKLRSDYFNEGVYNYGDIIKNHSNPSFIEKVNDSTSIISPYALDDTYITTRLNNALYADYYLNTNMKIQGFLAYNYYERKKNTYAKNLSTGDDFLVADVSSHDTTVFDMINSRTIFSHASKPHRFSYQFGYDIKHEKSRGERIENNIKSITDIGIFTSVEYNPIKKLSIQPGIRYAYNSRFDAPIIGSIALRFEPISNFIIRTSIGQGFRAPNLKELYFLFVDENHNILGNNQLKAESSENYQLSLSYNKQLKEGNIETSFGSFFNNLSDEIRLVAVVQPSDTNRQGVFQNINVARSQTTGGTLDVKSTYKQWSIALGTSLIGRKNDIAFDSTAKSLGYDKFQFYQQMRLNISYDWKKAGLTASLFCNYTGKRPDLGLIYNPNTDSNELGINEFEAYAITDFTLIKKLWKDKISLSTGIKNIFDVTNIQSTATISGGAHSSGSSSLPLSYGRNFFVGFKLAL